MDDARHFLGTSVRVEGCGSQIMKICQRIFSFVQTEIFNFNPTKDANFISKVNNFPTNINNN